VGNRDSDQVPLKKIRYEVRGLNDRNQIATTRHPHPHETNLSHHRVTLKTFSSVLPFVHRLFFVPVFLLSSAVMTALYTLQGSQLLVCMCGLPARGKTYIAQKGYSP
jgi:hypothetical protein